MPPDALRDGPATELREQLARYTPDRHPLKHATAQFHLGSLLLAADDLDGAEAAFTTAAALFGARGAHAEQAKSLNGLGATLRAAGRPELAARALEHAVGGLRDAGLALEEGAASFNLGLVLRDLGRTGPALEALQHSASLLDASRVPAQAAAVARELAVARLADGDAGGAQTVARQALELAERAVDLPGVAASANALGLALLASEDVRGAADAFATAARAAPRALRPQEFAMAKANLAIALERAGEAAAARLAARQALGAPEVPEPVREQAADALGRLGPGGADLPAVFAGLDEDARRALAREELTRSAGACPAECAADMGEWIAVHLAGEPEAVEVAELWLGALLELPPEALERIAAATMAALGSATADDGEAFRTAVTRAMIRFHVPQWLRLQEVFAQAASDLGDPGPWR